MHGAQHAGDELVNAVTLLHQWYKGRNPALVVAHISEMRENQFLKLLDLILQSHEVCDGLVTFVRVIDRLQADVLLVLESTCLLSACRPIL